MDLVCEEKDAEHAAPCRLERDHWDRDRTEHRSKACNEGNRHVHVWPGPLLFVDLAQQPRTVLDYVGHWSA